jgi:hypothetical protein
VSLERAELDLFGEVARPEVSAREKRYQPKGYAGQPGRGPAGETCKSCAHCYLQVTRAGKRFYKCDLITATAGPGTDIRLKSPACQFWEGREVLPASTKTTAEKITL